jgi:iron uptake system component EfeO
MRTTSRTGVLGVVALSAVLAACGSGSSGSAYTTSATPDLVVVAPGGLKFDQKAYTATAGDVEVSFQNKDSQTHSLLVERPDGSDVAPRMLLGPGKTSGEQLTLPAGQYKVVCDVPGHEGAGMVATLTVT